MGRRGVDPLSAQRSHAGVDRRRAAPPDETIGPARQRRPRRHRRQEAALAEALDDGWIAGAALDVFSSEPVKADNPLLALRDPYRLLASPHNAWATGEAIDTLVRCVARNIEAYLKK